jgi:hypothetical protein
VSGIDTVASAIAVSSTSRRTASVSKPDIAVIVNFPRGRSTTVEVGSTCQRWIGKSPSKPRPRDSSLSITTDLPSASSIFTSPGISRPVSTSVRASFTRQVGCSRLSLKPIKPSIATQVTRAESRISVLQEMILPAKMLAFLNSGRIKTEKILSHG